MDRDPRQILTEWLVLAAQASDEAAFRDLHGLWQADLRRLTQVRVEHSAATDEVLTDVWLAIARGLSRLGDPACFPRWAFRIVERRSADCIRQRCRARQLALAPAAPATTVISRKSSGSPLSQHRLNSSVSYLQSVLVFA